MDRDKRWERVKLAVDGLTKPSGVEGAVSVQDSKSAIEAVEAEYKKDITDEFLKPIVIGGDESRIKGKRPSLDCGCVGINGPLPLG